MGGVRPVQPALHAPPAGQLRGNPGPGRHPLQRPSAQGHLRLRRQQRPLYRPAGGPVPAGDPAGQPGGGEEGHGGSGHHGQRGPAVRQLYCHSRRKDRLRPDRRGDGKRRVRLLRPLRGAGGCGGGGDREGQGRRGSGLHGGGDSERLFRAQRYRRDDGPRGRAAAVRSVCGHSFFLKEKRIKKEL